MLGDKSMQIKYLNPNVLFVAAGLPDGVPLLPGGPPPELRIELLDTVTGRVLASFVHKVNICSLSLRHSSLCGCCSRYPFDLALMCIDLAQGARGPVHTALSENWAVYHYWSTANRRFEVQHFTMSSALHKTADLLQTGRVFPCEQVLDSSACGDARTPCRMQVAVAELYDIGPRNFKPKDLLFGSVVEVATSYEAAALEVRSTRSCSIAGAHCHRGLYVMTSCLKQ